jgi:hypothetical protein
MKYHKHLANDSDSVHFVFSETKRAGFPSYRIDRPQDLLEKLAATGVSDARLLSRLTIWSFDDLAAREYAKIASDLRRRGIAIQQIDMQTAALAFALGSCVVLSRRPRTSRQ